MSQPAALQDTRTEPISRRSTLIAAFSTVVEWYDFTLYLYMAATIADVFFGGQTSGLLATYGTFAIAYLMRPLGAMVFGHVGDRFGRRRMMLLSMWVMTVAMFATAALPSYQQIGIWSAWLLLLLRLVMAFSVGGEYTGVVAYLLEGSRRCQRGLVASLAAASSEVGALLAAFVAALTTTLVPADAMGTWGWRIPFVLGGLLAGVIVVARSAMEESPEFTRQEQEGTVPSQPLKETLRLHPGAVARTFAISALGSVTYYVGITYVPAFLHLAGGIDIDSSLWFSTVAAFAVIAVTPLFGWLSDRLGRRPVLVGLAVMAALTPYTCFQLMRDNQSMLVVLVASVVLAAIAGGVSAVAASATPEQFPGEGRLSGLALGVTVATAFFGGITPVLAQWFVDRGAVLAPGIMIAVVAIVVLPVIATLRETAPCTWRAERQTREAARSAGRRPGSGTSQ